MQWPKLTGDTEQMKKNPMLNSATQKINLRILKMVTKQTTEEEETSVHGDSYFFFTKHYGGVTG